MGKFFVVVFVITNCLVNLAFANDKVQVVTENWYPYNYLDQSGDVVGKSTTAVKAILDQAEVEYTIQVYPWTRALKLASTQPNILIYSILRTADREKMFYWFCPISTVEPHTIYKLTTRTDIVVNSVQDIKKYTISATRKTFLHQYMLNLGLIDNLNLLVNADDALGTKLFFAGRVDLIADLESSMDHALVVQGVNKSIVTPLITIPLQHYSANCMALSKQTPMDVVHKIKKSHQQYTATH